MFSFFLLYTNRDHTHHTGLASKKKKTKKNTTQDLPVKNKQKKKHDRKEATVTEYILKTPVENQIRILLIENSTNLIKKHWV